MSIVEISSFRKDECCIRGVRRVYVAVQQRNFNMSCKEYDSTLPIAMLTLFFASSRLFSFSSTDNIFTLKVVPKEKHRDGKAR